MFAFFTPLLSLSNLPPIWPMLETNSLFASILGFVDFLSPSTSKVILSFFSIIYS